MESTLIVERYGGNMMSLHAEPSREGEPGGDRPEASESELTFQTHTMKVRHCLFWSQERGALGCSFSWLVPRPGVVIISVDEGCF